MFRARSLRNVRSGSHSLALCQLGRKSVWASHRVQEVKFSTGRHSGAPRAIWAEMNRSRNGCGDVGQSLGGPALRPAILPRSWAWGQPKPNPGHGPVTAAAAALCLSLAAQAATLRSGRLSPACSLGRSSPSLRMGRVWKAVCVVVKAPENWLELPVTGGDGSQSQLLGGKDWDVHTALKAFRGPPGGRTRHNRARLRLAQKENKTRHFVYSFMSLNFLFSKSLC